jgi:hypothetical protein
MLSSGLRWVAMVIARSGYGVVRIRAVTMTKKGSSRDDSRDRACGEVLSVMPIVTDGLSELMELQETKLKCNTKNGRMYKYSTPSS